MGILGDKNVRFIVMLIAVLCFVFLFLYIGTDLNNDNAIIYTDVKND